MNKMKIKSNNLPKIIKQKGLLYSEMKLRSKNRMNILIVLERELKHHPHRLKNLRARRKCLRQISQTY